MSGRPPERIPASPPAARPRPDSASAPRRAWLAGLLVIAVIPAAMTAILTNLRAVETARIAEYRRLSEQIGKIAVADSALKQYDRLLDLMQLLTRTPAIPFIALQVDGETVLHAGMAPAGALPARPQAGAFRSRGGHLAFWVPLDANASRLREKSGLWIVFSLAEFAGRKRNILAFSALIALLTAALAVLLQLLDKTRRRLKIRNEELLRTQERLRQEEQTKTLMVRYLAHNANNHLNVLAARIANLQARAAAGRPPESPEADLGIMNENQKAIAYLIRNLHDHERLSRGEMPIHRGSVDLNALVRSVALSLEETAAEKHIRIETPAAGSVVVTSDGRMLEQVIMNLLVNAIRYSPPDTRIAVELKTNAAQTAILVRDQGPGIAPEDWERIFTPFVRLLPDGPKGSGLGLSNARLLLRQLGGDVRVRESEPGRGTTFSLELPGGNSR